MFYKVKQALKWLIIPTLLVLVLTWYFKEPLRLAAWNEDVSVLAQVELSEDKSTLSFKGLRDWRYELNKVVSKDYFAQAYKLEDLERVWFYSQPLDSTGLLAHTFVVFEFNESYGDRRELGISLEARKKVGEEYGMWKGAFKGFTLTHVWANAKDIVTRRTIYWDYELPLQKHELQLSDADAQGLLKAFVAETNELHQQPRFYNTLTYNCANALAYYANKAKPGSVPWHYSFILTGKSVEYLNKLGYIKN